MSRTIKPKCDPLFPGQMGQRQSAVQEHASDLSHELSEIRGCSARLHGFYRALSRSLTCADTIGLLEMTYCATLELEREW